MTTLFVSLEADINKEPVFLILPKRAYSTRTLIIDGSKLVSKEVRASLTQDEIFDIQQATKCLAFEVPTAAAFHLFRAMEGTIKRYYTLVIGRASPPKPARDWNSYITLMKKWGKPDPQTIFILDQVRHLFRNPITHPDEHVTMDKAAALLGLADTVLTPLTTEIKKLSACSAAPVAAQPSSASP